MQERGNNFQERTREVLRVSFQGERREIIPMLQTVQGEFGYLPEESIKDIARYISLPESKVYGVATFYAQFHFSPRGKYIVRMCRGTACHVKGVSKAAERMQELLGIGVGETTPDLKFTYEEVACIGACGLAPVMMINDRTYGKLTPDKVQEIIENYYETSEV